MHHNGGILLAKGPYLSGVAGDGGRMVLIWLRKLGYRPIGAIDNDSSKFGLQLDDLPICSPDSLAKPTSDYERPYVVISTIYADQVKANVLSFGCKETVDFFDQALEFAL